MFLVLLVGRHDRAEVLRQMSMLRIPRMASDGRSIPCSYVALPRLLDLLNLPKILLARVILLRQISDSLSLLLLELE